MSSSWLEASDVTWLKSRCQGVSLVGGLFGVDRVVLDFDLLPYGIVWVAGVGLWVECDMPEVLKMVGDGSVGFTRACARLVLG